MVDGDQIINRHGEEDKKKARQIAEAHKAWIHKNETPPEEKWTWYYTELLDQAKAEAAKGKNVAITWIQYKRYVRDWIRKECPGITFINLKVDYEILSNRLEIRQKKAIAQMGVDPQVWWDDPNDPDMVAAKEKYGDYTWDRML